MSCSTVCKRVSCGIVKCKRVSCGIERCILMSFGTVRRGAYECHAVF